MWGLRIRCVQNLAQSQHTTIHRHGPLEDLASAAYTGQYFSDFTQTCVHIYVVQASSSLPDGGFTFREILYCLIHVATDYKE